MDDITQYRTLHISQFFLLFKSRTKTFNLLVCFCFRRIFFFRVAAYFQEASHTFTIRAALLRGIPGLYCNVSVDLSDKWPMDFGQINKQIHLSMNGYWEL